MHNLNEQLFLFINGAVGQSDILDGFFVFITKFFVPAFIAVAVLWFFIVLPRKSKTREDISQSQKRGGTLVLSLGIVWPIVELIKGLVAFPRPTQLLQNVNSLVLYTSYDSFPSLHSAFAFAVATFVYHYSKSTGTILFLLAILVGISRIFVGVHYPLDVIVGACIGVFVPWALISIFKRFHI